MDSRPGDETLLHAVAGHDMGAFRTLYERHAGWLAIRLARRCNDRDLAADAIQDTFAVWQKPQGFRGDIAARLLSRDITYGAELLADIPVALYPVWLIVLSYKLPGLAFDSLWGLVMGRPFAIGTIPPTPETAAYLRKA